VIAVYLAAHLTRRIPSCVDPLHRLTGALRPVDCGLGNPIRREMSM
jgi:hypothetical protein